MAALASDGWVTTTGFDWNAAGGSTSQAYVVRYDATDEYRDLVTNRRLTNAEWLDRRIDEVRVRL